MKTAIRAGVQVSWAGLCIFAAGLGGPGPSSLAAEAETPSASLAQEVFLENREVPHNIANWSFVYNADSKPFRKEPDTNQRKVARGSLHFGGPADQRVSLLWDFREGKLYLDLNNNGDLTDDPAGVFSTHVSKFSYSSQVFTNVHLQLKTPAGVFPLRLDLHFFNPEAQRIYGSVICRSFWEGKVSLKGREWQVGRIDNDGASVGTRNKGYLLLRPWAERDQPVDLQSGLVDAFTFATNLFFDGQAYSLECAPVEQDGKSKYKLSFRETNATLGEAKVTGKFIHRLLLAPVGSGQPDARFTVVLDRPEGVVQVPVGNYEHLQLQIKAEKLSFYRQSYPAGVSRQSISIAATNTTPPILAGGGPLTNSVSAQRQGRALSLQYQLVGAEGAQYTASGQNRADPPQFVISKNGKPIHSGKFEFG